MSATALAHAPSRDVAAFEPHRTAVNDAKADALIALARRLRDWPLLETAVDQKIEEQGEFVRWWEKNVRGPGQSNSRRPGGIGLNEAEAQTGISSQQVSRWSKRLADSPKYREALLGATWRKAMAERGQSDLRGASGTGDNEWFTPAEYVELARKVLGTIELDPASHPAAQRVVKAKRFFTIADNGLAQEWRGKVWLNPPYAQPAIAQFADKMVDEVAIGHVVEAIMLTHNYTDTSWFQKLARAASAVCFTRGRIRFVSPSGDVAAPTQGQAFFYFGKRVQTFVAHFHEVGVVMVRREP